MTDNELLLAISDMMDKKLDARLAPLERNMQSMQNDIQQLKLFQEDTLLPRLRNCK